MPSIDRDHGGAGTRAVPGEGGTDAAPGTGHEHDCIVKSVGDGNRHAGKLSRRWLPMAAEYAACATPEAIGSIAAM